MAFSSSNWEKGTDQFKQATAAVHAAKDADVKRFVWSTLQLTNQRD